MSIDHIKVRLFDLAFAPQYQTLIPVHLFTKFQTLVTEVETLRTKDLNPFLSEKDYKVHSSICDKLANEIKQELFLLTDKKVYSELYDLLIYVTCLY